jgi:hypothetical protein
LACLDGDLKSGASVADLILIMGLKFGALEKRGGVALRYQGCCCDNLPQNFNTEKGINFFHKQIWFLFDY